MSPYTCISIQKIYSNVSCILEYIYKWQHIVLILLQSAFFTQHFVFENHPCWCREKVKHYFRQWKHPSSLRKYWKVHTTFCGCPRSVRRTLPDHPGLPSFTTAVDVFGRFLGYLSLSCQSKILLVKLRLIDLLILLASTTRASQETILSLLFVPEAGLQLHFLILMSLGPPTKPEKIPTPLFH